MGRDAIGGLMASLLRRWSSCLFSQSGHLLARNCYNRTGTLYQTKFAHSASTNHKEEYNEPGGYLFGRKPGTPWNLDLAEKIYVIFYLGGIAVFFFLYQYKPDTDPQTWAKKEALRRIKERGVDLDAYRHEFVNTTK